MKKLFVTGVVCVCGATLRADFTYQQTSQMTGTDRDCECNGLAVINNQHNIYNDCVSIRMKAADSRAFVSCGPSARGLISQRVC